LRPPRSFPTRGSSDLTFDRNHVQLLDQTLGVGQQFVELGRDAAFLQLLHDEGVEAIVDLALALQLLDLLAIEGGSVIAEQQNQRSEEHTSELQSRETL